MLTDGDRLPDLAAFRQRRAQGIDVGGVLLTVQLHGGQTQLADGLQHGIELGILEHADIAQRRAGHHRLGLGNIDAARALADEDQATVHRTDLVGGLGGLRGGEATDLVLPQDQLATGQIHIGLPHQRGADQEAIGIAAELLDLGVVVDPRFADDDAIARQPWRQLLGTVQIDGEIAQVAVVDAHHLGA